MREGEEEEELVREKGTGGQGEEMEAERGGRKGGGRGGRR